MKQRKIFFKLEEEVFKNLFHKIIGGIKHEKLK